MSSSGLDCVVQNSTACGGPLIGGLIAQVVATLLAGQCALKFPLPADRSADYLSGYDFIVVGAGSAGSPLAAGLSATPDWKVLLIEAGADPDILSTVPALFPQAQRGAADWAYVTEPQPHASRAFVESRSFWPRGKVMGGSSAINGMIYQIGNHLDYDGWAALGNTGWAWEDVRKYYEQHASVLGLERYDVRDNKTEEVLPCMRRALLAAAKEIGYEEITDDMEKAKGTSGSFQLQGTVKNGERNSAARVFLGPLVDRENLHVIKNAHVGKVFMDGDGKRIGGVEVLINGEWVRIKASKEVILSAGAINTPHILMLSGIGPKSHLKDLDIKVVKDLPVGKNLIDHTNTILSWAMHKKYNNADAASIVFDYMMYRQGSLGTISSGNIVNYVNTLDRTSPIPDMSTHSFYFRQNDALNFPKYVRVLGFKPAVTEHIMKSISESGVMWHFLTLLHPKSRGTVTLRSKDPLVAPVIDPQYHTHPDDAATVLRGLRHLQRLMATEAMAEQEAQWIPIPLGRCDSKPFDDSDEYWRCYISHMTSTLYHPVGTAKMAPLKHGGVVDERLRVHGVKGLRVADASIMPHIVRGNTNAASIMIGQKAADLIIEDYRRKVNTEL